MVISRIVCPVFYLQNLCQMRLVLIYYEIFLKMVIASRESLLALA